MQHGSTPLNLVTLYTATKAERLAQTNTHGQPKINKLISPYSDESGPELTHAVQSLCQQADAFLLVINTANLDSGKILTSSRDRHLSLITFYNIFVSIVIVVDLTHLSSFILANRDMDISLLNAMLRSSSVDHTPLLVLAASLSSDEVDSHPPAVQIAQWLSLLHIQHPWQVMCCNSYSRLCVSC